MHIEQLVSDVRYAMRGLARAPAFACAAVLTIALGLGATTAVFTVVDAVLLRPLPMVDVAGGTSATLATAGVLLVAVSAVACAIPALRASKVEPASALRSE